MKGASVLITRIDRSNHHLFQPLLYQVATAGLSAPAIAAPVRHIFRHQRNVTVLMAEARAVDVQRRCVVLDDQSELVYDFLIVATGATDSYFGNDDWAAYAPGLKTLDDALEIRRRVLRGGRAKAAGRAEGRAGRYLSGGTSERPDVFAWRMEARVQPLASEG